MTCGLTKDDVKDALGLLYGADEEKAQKHLENLEEYANGYHFCNTRSVPKVFNSATVMGYLQVIFLKQLVLNPVLSSFSTHNNSEANRQTLSILRILKSPR